MVPARMTDSGSGLFKRSMSAVVMIPAVLAVIYLGGLPFYVFIGVLWGILAHEWHRMPSWARARIDGLEGGWRLAYYALLILYVLAPAAFYLLERFDFPGDRGQWLVLLSLAAVLLFLASFQFVGCGIGPDDGGRLPRWMLFGALYSLPTVLSLIFLRAEHGAFMIFWLFAVVWGTDIGAYFTGRRLGGPKLAAKISPNKTWSGFFGGIVLAVLASAAVAVLAGYALPPSLAGAVVVSIVSQLGDLYESGIKRKLDVKDSGSIIPGHGGILDRIDGLLFAAPVMAFAVYFGILRL